MAGRTAAGVLMEFLVADPSHDAGIRRLLRETPMRGSIRITRQREPNYFASVAAEGGENHAIVAVDDRDEVVCVGAVSIRDRFFNGWRCRVGYLGQLRLAASQAGRFDIIRRGYRFFRELLPTLQMEACFTSVATDNIRAKAFLERGLPGMPRYRFAGDLVTLLMPVTRWGKAFSLQSRDTLRRQKLNVRHGVGCSKSLSVLLNARGVELQFAPSWDEKELTTMRDNNFCVVSDENGPVACAAVWDQRDFKQTVIAGYSKSMSLLRPLHNLFARVRLPRPGDVLPMGFVSHVATPPDRPDMLAELTALLTASAQSLGIETLAVGLDARDPRLAILLRRFPGRRYQTRLYTVTWPDQPAAGKPDGRLLFPEVALL
jgi:hypothetical protein